MGLFGKVAMSGSDAINDIVNLLANGKAGNTVVNYPDDLISQVPYDLRKEVALHNESTSLTRQAGLVGTLVWLVILEEGLAPI